MPEVRPVIVVVDDQALVREWICRVVRKSDYECQSAPDGFAALELIGDLPERPDLVITDVRMPRMSGVELSRQLEELMPSLPILYVCADDGDLPPGARHWLLKPFPPEQLVARIETILRGDAPGPAAE